MRRCKLKTCKTPIPTASKSVTIYNKLGFCGESCSVSHGMDAVKRTRERQSAKEAREARSARAEERKAYNAAKKERRKAIKTRQEWVQDAQRLINQIVVLEDKALGCITCIDGVSDPVTDSGHYFHRGNRYRVSPLTLLRANLNGQCGKCNRWEGGKQHEYRIGFIRRYGEAAFDELCEFKRLVDCGEIKPLTIPEVQDLIEGYKERLKELKRQP